MMLVLLPAAMWLAGCGKNDCDCDACETAIESCADDDADCEADAVALCDDSGDTSAAE
jgi:hypothetical protein